MISLGRHCCPQGPGTLAHAPGWVLGPARARRDRLAHCWCAVPRLLIPCSAAPPHVPRSMGRGASVLLGAAGRLSGRAGPHAVRAGACGL